MNVEVESPAKREWMLSILTRAIRKMQDEVPNAEGPRKKALLKLIGMGQKRVFKLLNSVEPTGKH